MKISSQILSIPPYLSTSWSNIASLRSTVTGERFVLTITLHDKTEVTIPALSESDINKIFQTYENLDSSPTPSSFVDQTMFIQSVMQHDPSQANAAQIPAEILEKIASLMKILDLEESAKKLQQEPNCNCPYCQIARTCSPVHEAIEMGDAPVSDEELQFRTWDVRQTADKLFVVTNPLDSTEMYNVFLGNPIGCTCGSKECEHIRAALNS